MTGSTFPEMPLDGWRDTKNTLHLYLQIVGKVRLAMHPFVNHWWHVPLYVSPRGLTTRSIPNAGTSFEIEFDLKSHQLVITTSDGLREDFDLYDGLTVADFYSSVFANLSKLNIHPKIQPIPYEAPSTIPFAEDRENKSYDRDAIERFHQIMVAVNCIFEDFRGRYYGKSTPVHLFWHSFDIALTRFSGRPAPVIEGANKVTQEAYSHEVISFGFWFGDDKEGSVAAPAFYSYTAPEPDGIADHALMPEKAFWAPANGSHMALLMYDDIRNGSNPQKAILDFLGSAFDAGSNAGNW